MSVKAECSVLIDLTRKWTCSHFRSKGTDFILFWGGMAKLYGIKVTGKECTA